MPKRFLLGQSFSGNLIKIDSYAKFNFSKSTLFLSLHLIQVLAES
jgi:hypothetical protein